MNLMFWKPGTSEVLDGRYADVDRGLAWGESELATTLVGQSLGNVTVGPGVEATYVTQNLRSETHLYARDPREITETLAEHAASGLLQLPGIWDALTPPGALPRSVVLSANRFTESNKRHLSTEDFFGDTTPEGPAASPPGGSVKAVRVYNHGACSHETLTAPGDGKGLLDEVAESVWKGFVKGVIVDEGECMDDRHPFLFSSSAVNYLDHVPLKTRDLRGGFFLHANYFASLPWYTADINTTFTARYQYTLVNGILGVNNASLSQNTDHPSVKDVPGLLKEGLLDTLPEKFAEYARAKQTRNILKDKKLAWATACDPTASYQCMGAAGVASSAAKNGADTLEALGKASFSSEERIALGEAMIRRVNGPGSPLQDWVCVPDNSETGGHCEFTIPAKRLNVYPDAVELVWFEAARACLASGLAGAGSRQPRASARPAQNTLRRSPIVRAAALLLGVALFGCSSVVSGPGEGGANGSTSSNSTHSTSSWSGSTSGQGGGWTDCSTPDGLRICGGSAQCEVADCLGCLVEDADITLCVNDASIKADFSRFYLCRDGEVFVDIAYDESYGLDPWCAPFDFGVLYSNAGYADRVRYADWGLFTGEPLPEPTSCPSVDGVLLCGGNCGGCPPETTCTGRSPLHPYGICAPVDTCEPHQDVWCGVGQGCFIWTVEPEAQELANRLGYCYPLATCEKMAAGVPGGGKCVVP